MLINYNNIWNYPRAFVSTILSRNRVPPFAARLIINNGRRRRRDAVTSSDNRTAAVSRALLHP